eukprot:jgi/Psemu1/15192/gm1.15192_g
MPDVMPMIPEPDPTAPRMTREVVDSNGANAITTISKQVGHKKYGTGDGYAPSANHWVLTSAHTGFFTNGFGAAVKKIAADHDKYVVISNVIVSYNNIILHLLPDKNRVNTGVKSFSTAAGVEAVLSELKQLHDKRFYTQAESTTILEGSPPEHGIHSLPPARPDVQAAIAFLCTGVLSHPDDDDWKKFKEALAYVKDTIFIPLVRGWDGTGNAYWFLDAPFAIHADKKSHT